MNAFGCRVCSLATTELITWIFSVTCPGPHLLLLRSTAVPPPLLLPFCVPSLSACVVQQRRWSSKYVAAAMSETHMTTFPILFWPEFQVCSLNLPVILHSQWLSSEEKVSTSNNPLSTPASTMPPLQLVWVRWLIQEMIWLFEKLNYPFPVKNSFATGFVAREMKCQLKSK